MTRTRPGVSRLASLSAMLLALAGCSNFFAPRVDPSRFFVLSVRPAPDLDLPAWVRSRSYGVGPIGLPDYLERPTVVTRVNDSEIRPTHLDRWAEPIEKGILRVLREDLRRCLDAPRVIAFPWYASDRPDYGVSIDFQRFEREPSGSAYLVAHWSVRDAATGENLLRGDTVARRDPATAEESASIEAQSDLLMQLAREIAQGIATIPVGRTSRR